MNGDEVGVVRVTTRDIYDAVQALNHKVDLMAGAVPDHEARLRSVERWTYALPPTLLVALAGVITSVAAIIL